MKSQSPRHYAKTYNQVALQSGLDGGDPHRLVQMLFDGALEKIAVARGHLERGQIAEKGRNIGWAISILEGLTTSLDMEAGGDIARNLFDLYDYMKRRLLEANLGNDIAALDEVAGLLREIRGAWATIAPERAA